MNDPAKPPGNGLDFENQLQQLQPADIALPEAELLYRCGWEAALASRAEEAEGHVPRDVAIWRTWTAPFLSGAVAGLAATLLTVAWMDRLPDQEHSEPMLATSEPSSAAPLTPPDRLAVTTSGIDTPPLESVSAADALSPVGPIPWSFAQGLSAMLGGAEGLPKSRESAPLSPAARRSWGETLAGPHGWPPKVQAVDHRPQRTPTLGELLFQMDVNSYH